MTRADLIKAGQALYGERWKVPLAERLAVDREQMARDLDRTEGCEHLAAALRAETE